MTTIDRQPLPLSIPHLVREPLHAQERPPVLFLLHGYGSNAEDLFDLAPLLPPEFLVVSLQASITLFPGQYAWFPLDWTSGRPVATPAEVRTAQAILRREIEALISMEGIDRERVFILGFSQGAILALSLAARSSLGLAGVVALSGRFPHEVADDVPDLSGARVFMGHGEADPVIPIQLARGAADILRQAQCELEYQEYGHGHGISPGETTDIVRWLSKALR